MISFEIQVMLRHLLAFYKVAKQCDNAPLIPRLKLRAAGCRFRGNHIQISIINVSCFNNCRFEVL